MFARTLFARTLAAFLLLVATTASADDELNLDYSGTMAQWRDTNEPISTHLCINLRSAPTAPDTAQLTLVAKTAAGWTTAPGAVPWPKANWGADNAHHCWEAPAAKKTYTIALLASPGAAPSALSSNGVDILDNPAPQTAGSLSTAEDEQKSDVMEAARSYLQVHKLTSAVTRSALTGRGEVTLYFLPDGTAATTIPTDLAERDAVHLRILMPSTEVTNASIDMTACPDENPTRVQGTFKSAAGFAQAQIVIAERDLGDLHCGSGQVSFNIKTPYGSSPTSLKLGDVYWGTFSVQFTFDFTQAGSLGVATGASGGSVISRNTDPLGPKVVPSFVWHPVGADPRHPSVLGAFLNPSLGFDVDAMTTSFYLGDQICVTGLCLALGAHLRKVDQLSQASGLRVGDAFDSSKAALPTEQRWSGSDGGVGFFVGASVDVNTAVTLLGK